MKFKPCFIKSKICQPNSKKSFSSSNQNKIQFVFLMTGAPGVGKGTFSKMLSKDVGIPEFSVGDELRRMIKTDDVNARLIQKTIKEGHLLDDQFIHQLVLARMKLPDAAKGIILDGFPRNLNQAKLFQDVCLVMDIFLADEVIIPKLLGRRLCKCCGNNYNVFSLKDNGYDMDPLLPKKDVSKCDDCNETLIMREDDKEDIIRERLSVYKEHTYPLLEYYNKQNKLLKFEPKRGKKDYQKLKQVIDDYLVKEKGCRM